MRQRERGALLERRRAAARGGAPPSTRPTRPTRSSRPSGRPGGPAGPGGARPPRPRPGGDRRPRGPGLRPVWRFAVDVPGEMAIEDYVRWTVTFDHAAIEDFVVARSDGTPTYNLAAAVDDLEMGITHVIRGEDHISNTPKQMMVIRALGGEPPRLRPRAAHPRPRQEAPEQAPRGRLGRGPRGGRLRPGCGCERPRPARLEPRRQDDPADGGRARRASPSGASPRAPRSSTSSGSRSSTGATCA